MAEAVPPVLAARLDGERGDVPRQDRRPVLRVLREEDLLARHGHDARPDRVLGPQGLGRVDGRTDLGAGRDDDQIGRPLAPLGEDDVPAPHRLGPARVLERADRPPRAAHDRRRVDAVHRDLVRRRHLVRVGRAADVHVRHGPEALEHLDRLVGRAVLAEADGVVRHDVQDAEAGEGRAPHGAEGVPGELEEGRAERPEAAVGEHSVAYGRHGVLPDAEADHPSLRRGLLEVRRARDGAAVRAGEVGRAADELDGPGRDGVEARLGEFARGLGRVLPEDERREVVVDALGQLAVEPPGQLRGLVGVRLAVLSEGRVPLGHGPLALLGLPLVVSRDVVVDRELFGGIHPVQLRLDRLDLGVAERRAVRGGLALLGRRAVADVGPDLDERGPVRGAPGLVERRAQAVEPCGHVVDREDLPAVRLVAHLDVLREGEVGAAVDRDVVVVVQHHEVPEAQVAGQAARLAGDALLQAAVAADDVRLAVDDAREVGRVERGAQVLRRDGHADGVRDALPERPGADLHPC